MLTLERDRRGIAGRECAGGEAVGTLVGISGESGMVESGEEERSGLRAHKVIDGKGEAEFGTQESDIASMSLIEGNSESELDAKGEYERGGE